MKKIYKVYKVVDAKDNYVMELVSLTKYYDVALNDAAFFSLTTPNTLYCVFEFDATTYQIKLCESFLR